MTSNQHSNTSDTVELLRQAMVEYAERSAAGEANELFDAEAEKNKAQVRKRALGLLDQRARSAHELRTRLVDAEFPPAVVDEVIDDLERVGLIDDAVFAREWVRQRHQRRGKSSRVLDRELQDKGVASSIRSDALATISDDDERALAESLAKKKARSIKAVPADRAERDKALRRIVGVLARRGFPQGMAMSVSIAALEGRIEELR